MCIKQKDTVRSVFLLFLTYTTKHLVMQGCLHYASRRKPLSGYVDILQQIS